MNDNSDINKLIISLALGVMMPIAAVAFVVITGLGLYWILTHPIHIFLAAGFTMLVSWLEN